MSYEGYTEHLCSQGHYSTCDAYAENLSCPICNAEIVWTHGVDQTNDSGNPALPKLRVKKKEVFKFCKHCGSKTFLTHKQYYIPRKIGHRV